MNELVSGAIGAKIALTGSKIYMPDIYDLRDKVIKYIDVCDELDTDLEGNLIDNTNNGFINLIEKDSKNLKINNLSLSMLSLAENQGNRYALNFKIDLVNSFISWNGTIDANKSIYLVFWFDEPSVMNAITSDNIGVDSFEISIVTPNIREKYLKENRTLYNKMFRNFLLLAPAQSSITPENRNSITEEESKKCFITFQLNNYAYIRNVPIYLFNQTNVRDEIRLQNITFNFTNSKVLFPPNVNLSNKSICFNAVYSN